MSMAATLAFHAAAGLAAGAAFFASLHWLVRRLFFARAHAGLLALFHALRFFALAALLAWCARRGAGPLLATAAGILGTRVLLIGALRRIREPAP
jgi:hypothetical protein